MIKSLQSLRGIFALFIFLHHIPLFPAGGDCAVCFFFILSGFILTLHYATRVNDATFSYSGFLRHRIDRIYPLHIIGLISALLLFGNYLGSKGIFIVGLNALLLQSWIPLDYVFFSCNAVAWFLSDIVVCYAIFPPLVRWLRMQDAHPARFILRLIIIYIVLIHLIPGSLMLGLIYINPLFRLVDFCIGVCLGLTVIRYKSQNNITLARNKTLMEFAAISLMAICIYFYPEVSPRYSLASYWWLPSICMIYVFYHTDHDGGLFTRLLHNRLLVKFGQLSFSFYIVHNLTIKTIARLIAGYGIDCPTALFTITAFIASITVSLIITRMLNDAGRRIKALQQ